MTIATQRPRSTGITGNQYAAAHGRPTTQPVQPGGFLQQVGTHGSNPLYGLIVNQNPQTQQYNTAANTSWMGDFSKRWATPQREPGSSPFAPQNMSQALRGSFARQVAPQQNEPRAISLANDAGQIWYRNPDGSQYMQSPGGAKTTLGEMAQNRVNQVIQGSQNPTFNSQPGTPTNNLDPSGIYLTNHADDPQYGRPTTSYGDYPPIPDSDYHTYPPGGNVFINTLPEDEPYRPYTPTQTPVAPPVQPNGGLPPFADPIPRPPGGTPPVNTPVNPPVNTPTDWIPNPNKDTPGQPRFIPNTTQNQSPPGMTTNYGASINTSITPTGIYSPRQTQAATNQAIAHQHALADPYTAMKMTDRPGFSRSASNVAQAMPMVMAGRMGAAQAGYEIPFKDQQANLQHLLAGEVGREGEALDWGSVLARLLEMQSRQRSTGIGQGIGLLDQLLG